MSAVMELKGHDVELFSQHASLRCVNRREWSIEDLSEEEVRALVGRLKVYDRVCLDDYAIFDVAFRKNLHYSSYAGGGTLLHHLIISFYSDHESIVDLVIPEFYKSTILKTMRPLYDQLLTLAEDFLTVAIGEFTNGKFDFIER